MKKIGLISVMGALLVCTACSQKPGFTVKGNVEGLAGENLMLTSAGNPDKEPKQIPVNKDGSFEFRDTVAGDKPALYTLLAPGMQLMKHGAMFGIPLRFIAQNGDNISIKGNLDEYRYASVSGNKMDVQLMEMNQLTKDVQLQEKKIWDQIEVVMKERNAANRPKIDSLENLTDPYEVRKREILINYISQHPNDPVSAIALDDVSHTTADLSVIEKLYSTLGADAKQSGFAAMVSERLGLAKSEKQSGEGKPAPDFTKMTLDGKPFKLSDYKGKYVLLDFWGSWCGPCRASHPHLKEVYAKYKNDGLVVVGIAEERTQSKTAWLKAIQEDGLPWTQILNDQGKDQSDVVSLYGIKAFPTKILIDKEGNIIMRYEGTNMAAGVHTPEAESPTSNSASAATAAGLSPSTKSSSGSASSSATVASSEAGTTIPSDDRSVPSTPLDEKLKQVFNK